MFRIYQRPPCSLQRVPVFCSLTRLFKKISENPEVKPVVKCRRYKTLGWREVSVSLSGQQSAGQHIYGSFWGNHPCIGATIVLAIIRNICEHRCRFYPDVLHLIYYSAIRLWCNNPAYNNCLMTVRSCFPLLRKRFELSIHPQNFPTPFVLDELLYKF